MDQKELWNLLQKKIDTQKQNINQNDQHHLDGLYDSIKLLFEDYLQEQITPGLAYPHPRSRIYRHSPKHWNITDTTYKELFAHVQVNMRATSKPAACVFDLDGTLFDVSPRTLGIVNEWLESAAMQSFDKTLTKKISKINMSHIGYSIAHAFENAGFNLRDEQTADLFSVIERFWKRKFFDGVSLVKYDTLIPGSDNFVNSIKNIGITPIYLTGRHAEKMTEGTLTQLEKFGFPHVAENVILKENVHAEDHIFKAQTMRQIQKKYDVVANFENEYINLAHMAVEVPKALNVIVDTHHSGRPVPDLNVQIYRVFGFS